MSPAQNSGNVESPYSAGDDAMPAWSMRPSRVLRKLRAGEIALSMKVNLSEVRAVEIFARSGFDCVWLDLEHVPNDIRETEAMIYAAKAWDVDPMVRVRRGSYSDMLVPLEADAAGVMVPHVMSADDAREVAYRMRFHPIGRRPMDGGNSDGGYTGVPTSDYIEQANRERFVIVQIEDPEPLDELDEIAAVEGIDMLLFGPGDFSHALGMPGQITHPDVEAAGQRVVAAAKAVGKFVGTVGNPARLPALLDQGYQFINVGSDVGGLLAHSRKTFAESRRELEKRRPPQR